MAVSFPRFSTGDKVWLVAHIRCCAKFCLRA